MTSSRRRIFFWLVVIFGLLWGMSQNLNFPPAHKKTLIINEFMADNETILADEDGEYGDWIEIYNPSSMAMNLAGWALTDDPNDPEKWPFPDRTLGGEEYLVIFASGKDRTSETSLHTNFKLDKAGEFLALYNILDQQWVYAVPSLSEAPPKYPDQLPNVAYGYHQDRSTPVYLEKATPDAPNETSILWEGKVTAIEFNFQHGLYEQPFQLELKTLTSESTIRYTLDGSEPTESHGTIYTEPLTIDSTTTLRVAAFKPGFRPSYLDTQTYIFLEDILSQPSDPSGFPPSWGFHTIDFAGYAKDTPVKADYEVDPNIVQDPRYQDKIKVGLQAIPTLSLVTDVKNFYVYANPRQRGEEWERSASVELIYPHRTDPGFQINAGVRIQGGAGRWEFMPKHSFRLFFTREHGPTKLNYPLFPDSPVESFDTLTLRAGVDRSYAGHPEVADHALTTYSRDEWLRASQIEISGLSSHGIFVHLYLNGLYWGLYNVIERPDASFTSSYLGGKKEEWLAANHRGIISGSSDRFTTLIQMAEEGNLDDPQKYETIQAYLDVPQFLDYLILNWYAGTRDWPENNWYAGVHNPDGQVRYFIWDGEESWREGAEIHLGQDDLAGIPNTIKIIFEALIQNPDFKMTLADRIYKHLFNGGALTEENAQARWLEINAPLEQAIIGESMRWGDARYEPPITPDDWREAHDQVLAQMEGNVARFIAQARSKDYYPPIDPPTFNQHGGLVTDGFKLMIHSSEETSIYYTVDGTDPRQPTTETIAPTAHLYQEPWVLTTTTHLKARTFTDGTWSALNEATFTLIEQKSSLQLTEIMYNPPGGDDYEFIELQNTGNLEIGLAGLYFDDGIQFMFPLNTPPLSPGEFAVLVRNSEAFAHRYPDIPITGSYFGQLSNKGEQLTLKDARDNTIWSIRYDDGNGWPLSPDGRGDSLTLINLSGDPNDPTHWRASHQLNGSPGFIK